MPGTTPAASQLDWLISSTTTMVLFCSKAIRERLRSSTWVMGAPPSVFAQRQRCQTFAAVPIASGPVSDIGIVDSGPQDHYGHRIHNPLSELKNEGRSCHSMRMMPALIVLDDGYPRRAS